MSSPDRILDPTGLNSKIQRAKLLIEAARDLEAVSLLQHVVAQDPENIEVRLLLAQALTGSGNGDHAEQHLRKATEDPEHASMALGMLGYWFQARGRFAESKECFEKSIQANPNQSLAYYGWVQSNKVTALDKGILDQALAVSLSPSTPQEDQMYLHYVLGKGFADLGEYEQSMSQYDLANADAFQLLLDGKPFPRGRYAEIIDANIATFDKEFFLKQRGVGSNSRKPIFVVGMMRSGTTLVEQILSSHPQVGAAGEVEFWLDTGSKLFDANSRTVHTKLLGQSTTQYMAALESICSGTERATDKMPQNFQMLGLIHLAFPKAPIIHIRRNPVDTCISIYTTAYQGSPAFAHDRDSIVFAYRQYQRLVAHWRKVLPTDRFLEVDYEDLTSNPEPVIRRMVAFCGLPWNNACLKPEQNDRLVTTPSLWQVRQPMYRTAVERWKVYEPWLGSFRELLSP